MTKIRTVIVRQPRSGAVLEWRPSSERASLRELVQMLEEDPDSPEVAPIDLIEPNTARLLDLESEVGDLQGEVLVARGGFLRNALDQMEALREQSPSLISFTQVAGSPVIGAELRVPALQATPGRPGVRIRGRHQLLVVLPSTFPEAPPRLVWLTPIFHPNIAMDHDAWPRGYEWNKSSSLLQLVSALIDSVAGLNVSVRGRFSLSRHKALNDQATSWFRKNGQQIANYGRLSLHSDMWRPEQQPLTSSNESWILEGVTHGGDPVVFLSGRFHRGLERFAKYGPGWLLGTRGHQGKHPWYYIDRAVPWRPESSAPPDTIGLLRHIGADLVLVRDANHRNLRKRRHLTSHRYRRDGPSGILPRKRHGTFRCHRTHYQGGTRDGAGTIRNSKRRHRPRARTNPCLAGGGSLPVL